MNKTVIAFIILVVVGLAIVIIMSNRNNNPTLSQTASEAIGAKQNNAATIVVPSKTTPTPTFIPISANKATIDTVKGKIEVELYPNEAPKTVTNFATLAKNKYYDGLTFHRVEPGFVIQGGDPSGNGTGGHSIYGLTFEDEINPESSLYKEGYKEGVLAMANRGPNTNGSQFFIMWQDNTSLPPNYTIFGKVTNGMDVVHKMVAGDKINSITVK